MQRGATNRTRKKILPKMSPEIRFHFIFQIEHTLGMEKQERAGDSSWEAQQQGGRWISLHTGWNGHAAGSFAASRSFSR